MEKLISAALVAWNPVGAVSHRRASGELDVANVIVPFMAVYVAANAAQWMATKEFLSALYTAADRDLVVPAILENTFANQALAVMSALLAIGAIALLPGRLFEPAGRTTALAAVFVLFASMAFYSAVATVLVALLSISELGRGVESAVQFYSVAQPVAGLLMLVLLVEFTRRVLRTQLRLRVGAIVLMLLISFVAQALAAVFFISRLPAAS